MNEENLSAIEIYMSNVFKIVILLFPLSTIAAAAFAITMKMLFGYYPEVSATLLAVFASSCTAYLLIALVLLKHSFTSDGALKAGRIKKGKIYVAVLELIQWNFMCIVLTRSESFMFYAYFLMLDVFFLDSRFVLLMIAELTLSTIAQWAIRPNIFLPATNSLFAPNLLLRLIFLFLTSFCLWLITYLVETKLANELEKLADYDTLTLLHNRRSMKSHIASMMKSAQKGDGTFSLLMCDLDNFKRINDTYGHDCGDLILKTVANIISCDVRKDDEVFRYGGEEILVMVRADKEVTAHVAERIRADIEKERVSYNSEDIGITVTIGVASYRADKSIDELIKIADNRLYFGKQHGKNQVVNA